MGNKPQLGWVTLYSLKCTLVQDILNTNFCCYLYQKQRKLKIFSEEPCSMKNIDLSTHSAMKQIFYKLLQIKTLKYAQFRTG